MVAVMVGRRALARGDPAHRAAGAPAPHATIRDRHDLVVTLFARGWIVLGMTLLNTYVLYFFNDVLGARDASLKTGLVAGSALVGAIVSSVLAGKLSDRFDRRSSSRSRACR